MNEMKKIIDSIINNERNSISNESRLKEIVSVNILLRE
jgi:hypothetical protein